MKAETSDLLSPDITEIKRAHDTDHNIRLRLFIQAGDDERERFLSSALWATDFCPLEAVAKRIN